MENNYQIPAIIEELQAAKERVQGCLLIFSLSTDNGNGDRLKNQLLSIDRTLNAIQRDQTTTILKEFVNSTNQQLKFSSLYTCNNDESLSINYLSKLLFKSQDKYIDRLKTFFESKESILNEIKILDQKIIQVINIMQNFYKEQDYFLEYNYMHSNTSIEFTIMYQSIELNKFSIEILDILDLTEDEIKTLCVEYKAIDVQVKMIEQKKKKLEKDFKSKVKDISKINLDMDKMEKIIGELDEIISHYS